MHRWISARVVSTLLIWAVAGTAQASGGRTLEVISRILDRPFSAWLMGSPEVKQFAKRLQIAGGDLKAIERMSPEQLQHELRQGLLSPGAANRVSFSRLESIGARLERLYPNSNRDDFLRSVTTVFQPERILFSDLAKHSSGRTMEAFERTLAYDASGKIRRYPKGIDPVQQPDAHLQFGFESEYTLAESARLLEVYGPDAGMSAEMWLQMSGDQKVRWVQERLGRAPGQAQDSGLIKLVNEPEFDFLPDRLLQDSTGNLEIVLKPVNTLEDWYEQVTRINRRFGTGSMQSAISLPSEAFFGQAGRIREAFKENAGFLNFMNDLDTLQKLEIGAERLAQNGSVEAAKSFQHPWLGPMTRIKQRKLEEYLRRNAVGELWNEADLLPLRHQDDSFKYVSGTVYRPDLAGPQRAVFEVRDAHKSQDILRERIFRAAYHFQSGREQFSEFSRLTAFDSVKDYQKLPEKVRMALEKVFPARPKAGLEYTASELTSIQVYRNFAYPMRDWSTHVDVMGIAHLAERITDAQSRYLVEVGTVSGEVLAGTLTREAASLRFQAAVANFSKDSGLARALQDWHALHLSGDPAWARYMNVNLRELAPLHDAYPVRAWEGALSVRAERWVNRHMDRAAIVEDVGFSLNEGGVNLSSKRPVLIISTEGLDDAGRAMLVDSYMEALSSGMVSFPAVEGAGHLYTRLGNLTFDHLQGLRASQNYVSSLPKIEPILALNPIEDLRLRHYVDRAVKNYDRTIGGFAYNGMQGGENAGWLFENRARVAGRNHNCTSWVCMAPVGDVRQSLLELAGATTQLDVHTNPGWWLSYLVAGAPLERVPYVVYWTTESLSAARQKIRPGEAFVSWRFNLH